MKKVVVLFTKPFGAYAKGDRAGFDAEAAQHLQGLGVAKPDAEPEAEPEAELEQQVLENAEDARVDAADEQPLPDSEEAAPVEAEQQPKPAGKAAKGAKA